MAQKIAVFTINDPAECSRYSALVNDPAVVITNKIDGMTKEGVCVRVVDYYEKAETPAYVPPIS